MPKIEANSREVIAFLAGAQEFCIDIRHVREIRVWTPVTPIAHAPSFVIGIINLRGLVLPIVDLAFRLGLSRTIPTNRHAILVIETDHEVAGLLVEGVSEILTVLAHGIQPPPEIAATAAHRYVEGIVVLEGRLISLLALNTIIPARDLIAA